MQGMYQRLAAARVSEAARSFPAVVILGARQVGKTTLARQAFPDLPYLDCEDPATMAAMREDVCFVLAAREKGGLIIDEAQSVGSVFGAIRGSSTRLAHVPGAFIVLGSAQPTLIRGDGRVAGRACRGSRARRR